MCSLVSDREPSYQLSLGRDYLFALVHTESTEETGYRKGMLCWTGKRKSMAMKIGRDVKDP